jgi:hypothetical protein
LSAGTYTGSITITATNPAGEPVPNSPVTIPVTLLVSVGTLSAAPASLAFTQIVGSAVPAPQSYCGNRSRLVASELYGYGH